VTSTLPAQPWQNPKKIPKSPFFNIKITAFLLPPYQPTGHCANASMASPPLYPRPQKQQLTQSGGDNNFSPYNKAIHLIQRV